MAFDPSPGALLATRWPHELLGYRATVSQARRLARKVVSEFGRNPSEWLDAAGFEVKDEPGNPGGLEALCLPMEGDRFRFIIYGADRGDTARRDFLICHETAHTFFYSRPPDSRPRRSMRGSDWEEDFCDVFALTVTGRSPSSLGLCKAVGRV